MRQLYLAKNDKDRPVEAACFGNEVQEELKVFLVFLRYFVLVHKLLTYNQINEHYQYTIKHYVIINTDKDPLCAQKVKEHYFEFI